MAKSPTVIFNFTKELEAEINAIKAESQSAEPESQAGPNGQNAEYVISYTDKHGEYWFGAKECIWPVSLFYATSHLSNDDVLMFESVDAATTFIAEIEKHTTKFEDKPWTVLVLQVSDIHGLDVQRIIDLKRDVADNQRDIATILNQVGE